MDLALGSEVRVNAIQFTTQTIIPKLYFKTTYYHRKNNLERERERE